MVTMAFLVAPASGVRSQWKSATPAKLQRPRWACAKASRARSFISMKDEKSESPEAEKDLAVDDVPFELRGFSLGNLGVLVGGALTVYSFYSYFASSGTASATSLGFVYGIPILLIGLALKYAELKPVPVLCAMENEAEADALREAKATEVQKKIIRDVTRHRYGDEQHMDSSLKSLGLIVRANGGTCPEMLRVVESLEPGGQYGLSMIFYSKDTPYKLWEESREKAERFFGPGLACYIRKVDEANRIVEMKLVTKGN
mmetsp:Transcript_50306/g.123671  ORF Transcript_50306/g.123671 Transcript_50306/m.123671 type:complete len:258 (-) Transcript_50306:104-877(-)